MLGSKVEGSDFGSKFVSNWAGGKQDHNNVQYDFMTELTTLFNRYAMGNPIQGSYPDSMRPFPVTICYDPLSKLPLL